MYINAHQGSVLFEVYCRVDHNLVKAGDALWTFDTTHEKVYEAAQEQHHRNHYCSFLNLDNIVVSTALLHVGVKINCKN